MPGLAFRVVVGLTLWASIFVQAEPAPRRIVSLVPAATEMLFAMGAGREVVAVSSFDREPPDVLSLPRVGALVDPNLEAILSLRPDLVVVYASQADLQAQLARSSIPTFVFRHGGLADVTRAVRDLGKAIGRPADGDREAAAIDARLAAVGARIATTRRPRVLLVFGRERGSLRNIYASGGVGFLHDMLVLAGGVNVLADVARENVQATTELVLARLPDVILEIHAAPTGPAESATEARAAWQRLPAVPAVANGRVLVLSGSEFVIPGPRVAGAAERMARALHPRAF